MYSYMYICQEGGGSEPPQQRALSPYLGGLADHNEVVDHVQVPPPSRSGVPSHQHRRGVLEHHERQQDHAEACLLLCRRRRLGPPGGGNSPSSSSSSSGSRSRSRGGGDGLGDGHVGGGVGGGVRGADWHGGTWKSWWVDVDVGGVDVNVGPSGGGFSSAKTDHVKN